MDDGSSKQYKKMISHIANLAIVLLLGLTSIVLMGVDTKGAQFGCDGISAVMRSHYGFTSIQTSPQNSNSSAQEEKPVAVNHAFIGKEVDTKVIISKKPRPKYTKTARAHKVEGTVVLKVVFSSTGEVNNIHTVTGLPFGLTERAIEAAHKIKFKPAIKDGRPVFHVGPVGIQLQFGLESFVSNYRGQSTCRSGNLRLRERGARFLQNRER